MLAHTAAICGIAAYACAGAGMSEQSTAPLCVTLASLKNEYVLGEPVVLIVAAKNASNEDVDAYQIFVEDTEPEISIYISQNGKTFEPYAMGVFGNVNYERNVNLLPPGQAWLYRLRVLYTYKHPSHLAFPKAGRYWLKAVFPLMGRKPTHPSRKKEFESSGREEFQSNTIQISIKEPEGVDATLWKTLRDPEFLHFIQGGFPPQEDSDVPLRVARLVNSVSDSSYHAALRWALKEYSLHNKLEGEAKREIEKALSPQDLLYVLKRFGLDRIPEPPRPFPEDPRLDLTLKLHYPKETNWEQVLEDVSKQSGIRLLIARGVQFPSEGIAALHWTPTLRQVMNMAAYTRGNWIREGNGYRLIPVHLGSGKAPVKTGGE